MNLDKRFMMRKQSENKTGKGWTIQQKMELLERLDRILNQDQPFNTFHTLFGYTLGFCGIDLFQRQVFDIKAKFSIIQELFFSKTIDKRCVLEIVIDALNQFKKCLGKQLQKLEVLITSLQINIEESAMFYGHFRQKWQREQRLEEENRQNQEALRALLEQQSRENKMKAQQHAAQGWQCPVCLTQIDRQRFGLLQCSHIFHPQCINAYLKSKIESSQVNIICPMQGCGKPVQIGDIYGNIDGYLREKYEKFTFNRFVEQNGACTAWCPTAGCTAAFQFEQALDNYKCPACTKHYCLKCRCEYHYGMTCAEYKVNNSFDKNDEDFIKYVQGNKYKQCPKCKHWVERVDGCSTMACRCGQEFCYMCGGTTCPHGMCSVYPDDGMIRPVRPLVRPALPVMPGFGGRGGRGGRKR